MVMLDSNCYKSITRTLVVLRRQTWLEHVQRMETVLEEHYQFDMACWTTSIVAPLKFFR